MPVKLNDKYLGNFLSEYDKQNLEAMWGRAGIALEKVIGKTGEGSEAIGWADLPENYDKEEIERIAVTELNMHKRKPHQEIRINVPKASYIVQNKPKTEAPRAGILENIKNFIFRK